jgi:hypothetical protein
MEDYTFEYFYIVNIVVLYFEGESHELIVEGPYKGRFPFEIFDDSTWSHKVIVKKIRVNLRLWKDNSVRSLAFKSSKRL